MTADGAEFIIQLTMDDGKVSSIRLGTKPIVIGSAPDVDFQVSARYVSSHHLRISRIGDTIHIVDLGSKNGTFLNGRKIPANQQFKWYPGNPLSIGKVQLQLAGPPPASIISSPDQLDLRIDSQNLVVGTPSRLSLHYNGMVQQRVYFEGNSLASGIAFRLNPPDAIVEPGEDVEINAVASPTRFMPFGGTFTVEFSAFTTDGLFDSVQATARARPPYYLWALFIVLAGIVLTLIPSLLQSEPEPQIEPIIPTHTLVAILPSSTATDTPQPSLTNTETATSTPTATQTTTSTATTSPTATVTLTSSPTRNPSETPLGLLPSLTPTATAICFNQCAAYGWTNSVIQPGDTLFSLAQSANVSVALVAQVNCIADPGVIIAGQSICLPCVDGDGDGVCDNFDNCPSIPNPDQIDANNDGIGDACTPPFSLTWVTQPPSLMASVNNSCPGTPNRATAVVNVASGFGVAEVIADLDVSGVPSRPLSVRPANNGNYNIEFQIPVDAAVGGNKSAGIRVSARDSQGRNANISTAFTVTRCDAPQLAPLAMNWGQQVPAQMTTDNFYCPSLTSSATATFTATSDYGVSSLTASIVFSPSGTSFNLPITDQGNNAHSFVVDLVALGQGNGVTANITVNGMDSGNNARQLTRAISSVGCSMTVNWVATPGGSVTVDNRLCAANPMSVQGTLVASVPSVVMNVAATVTAAGLNVNLPVTSLGNGQYSVALSPSTLGIVYTGAATINVTVTDQRSQTYPLSSGVNIADCTLNFTLVTPPDATIAGSNATCPSVPKQTSAFVRASLPSAVASVTARIDIHVGGVLTSSGLPVVAQGGGLYEVFINASSLPIADPGANPITINYTDIAAGGGVAATTSTVIQDCRGNLSWVNPPPAQLSLTACATVPALGSATVLFQAQVPALVPLASVTSDGRNSHGVVSYAQITSPASGQFQVVIDNVPAGTVVGDTLVVRGFAPDHRETPSVTTTIATCPP